MTDALHCPKCQSSYAYEDSGLFCCPECGYEWSDMERGEEGGAEERLVRDANGAILRDGDTVTVVKDLKIKGSSSVVKVGTKVRNMASLLVALIVGLTAQIVILRKQ